MAAAPLPEKSSISCSDAADVGIEKTTMVLIHAVRATGLAQNRTAKYNTYVESSEVANGSHSLSAGRSFRCPGKPCPEHRNPRELDRQIRTLRTPRRSARPGTSRSGCENLDCQRDSGATI